MAAAVYILCLLTAIGCAWALFAGHRRSGSALLFWSAMCFALLALNDALVLLDIYVIGWMELFPYRRAVGFFAVVVMLVGLIFYAPEHP